MLEIGVKRNEYLIRCHFDYCYHLYVLINAMINSHDILKLLSNFILEKFGYNAASEITLDEEQIARNLFNCLIAILEYTSYVFENESTLDVDEESTYLNAEDLNSATLTLTQFDVAFDTDYQSTDNGIDLDQQFLLEYI